MRSIEDVERELLNTPLDRGSVKSRKGAGGSELSYLEGHEVKRRMNKVFGPLGWDVVHDTPVLVSTSTKEGDRGPTTEVVYMASCRVTVHVIDERGAVRPIFTEGHGLGNGTWGDRGTPMQGHELAAKEAETDAFKRAVNRFGDMFGLALYDKKQTNVVESLGAHAEVLARIEAAATEDDLKKIWTSVDAKDRGAITEAYRARLRAIKGA